jgi:hypothetical protein
MTPIVLLDQLKLFTEVHTSGLLLPVKPEAGATAASRAAQVWKMRLPEMSHSTKKAPYILLQLVNGSDTQEAGQEQDGKCYVRIVFCVYSEDDNDGALHLLNLMTRLRIALLENRVIGGQFELQLPLEWVCYPDDTAPYFMGEMATEWSIPPIERKCKPWLEETAP